VNLAFGRPPRRHLVLASAVVALTAGTLLFGPRWLERRIVARITNEATRRGLVATISDLHVGLLPEVSLKSLRVEKPGSWSVDLNEVRVTLRVWGRGLLGRARVAVGSVAVSGPGELAMNAAPTRWRIVRKPEGGLAAELEEPGGALTLSWASSPEGARFEVVAADVPAGGILELRRRGALLCDPGMVGGKAELISEGPDLRFGGDLRSRGFRAAAMSDREAATSKAAEFGPATDVTLRLDGSWSPAVKRFDLPRWRIETDGVVASGSLRIEGVPGGPSTEGRLEVERVDFARLLASAGLEPPDSVAHPAARVGPEDMGSASLSASFKGMIADPASFVVTQRLDFTPPRRPVPAIERLRGDFEHQITSARYGRRTLDVSARSPDFIAIADVPPLFVRTLLLGEDSGFFGHSGLDLGEVPAAILTNWARGGAARGASTISQQLAKNLFLSRDKQMGRKLQELSLALLLEARLGKQRILEIYLNVIEWGPDLYGLRPAARRYFGREPGELTPGQMALLVALIPGPVKYQRSLAAGRPSPGFRPLVDGLLAKLRSVDAISEEEYQEALADELPVRTDPSAAIAGEPAEPGATMPSDEPSS